MLARQRPDEQGALESGVFALEDGHARWRPLRILDRANERAAVEGLAEGTVVVTMGHERVADGSALRPADGES